MSSADTIVALENGKIAQIGTPQELLAYESYVANLDLDFRDEESIKKSDEDARIERTVAESCISSTVDEVNNTPDIRRKNGDWSVYSYYFASSSYTIVIMFLLSMAVWIFCTEFASRYPKALSNSSGD